MKKIWLIPLLLALAASARAEVVNRIVASIDGEAITLFELTQYEEKQRALLPEAAGNITDSDALQALITEKLLAKEIAARGIQVRDEDVDRYVAHIKEANKITNDEDLQRALEAQGLEISKYREQVKREIEKIQLLNREIRGKVNVTPEDVHRYYEAHKAEYQTADAVHLRQIVLRLDPAATDEIAEAVTERLAGIRQRIVKDGEDFAVIAKQVSEDPAASSGGDLGEVDPKQVLPEFEMPLRTMKEGEVSEPIRTKMGVHLLKLEKRSSAGYTPESELADGIKEKLYNQALDERYKRWILEDIQKNHFVEVKL